METENQLITIIQPITSEERDAKNHPLPAIRERAVQQVEQYITSKKRANISDIARQLDVQWETAEVIVSEITERWRKEDIVRLQDYRKRLTQMADFFIGDAEKEANTGQITINKMKDMIQLFKDIASITKLEERPVSSVEDSSNVVAVHFNNMNLTPSMVKDLQRVQNLEVEVVVDTTTVQQIDPIVESQPIEQVESQPENGTDSNSSGDSGSEQTVV